ncbi:MAG: Polynucleotide adenylyltransferase region [Gemmatimonadetes bacterium]|nr:Polynucleotide adenylyltransferase region [Gemmatimonadota bacterium]
MLRNFFPRVHEMHRLRPTRSVLAIADRLEKAGFEAWCVGGAIRDALLGGSPLDWDLATSATPQQVQELFGRKRTIPVGIEFGTVAVLDEVGVAHEITTFRRDVKTDGRHAVVEFGASLDDDLARRDFTINAIAFRPSTDEVRDPFHGQEDLRAGIVRAVGDPHERLREDRLRALRGIRFAARYDFKIDDATLAAIHDSAAHLTRLSAERVQQEIVKSMQQVSAPSAAFRIWRDSGAFRALVPALGDVSDVALATLDHLPRDGAGDRQAPQRTANRIAALFLDRSPAQVRSSLTALRFSRHDVAWATALVERWVNTGTALALALAEPVADIEIRRWHAELGRIHAGPFLRVAGARWTAMREAGEDAPSAAAVRVMHKRMFSARHGGVVEIGDLAIGGDELRAAGIPAGPIYAKILRALLEWVIEEPDRNTPAQLLSEVSRIRATIETGSTT